jgi:hypothetical protein
MIYEQRPECLPCVYTGPIPIVETRKRKLMLLWDDGNTIAQPIGDIHSNQNQALNKITSTSLELDSNEQNENENFIENSFVQTPTKKHKTNK